MGKTFDEEAFAAVELSRRKGVGAKTFKRLIQKYGTPRKALTAYSEERPNLLAGAHVRGKKSATEAGIEAAGEFLEGGGTVMYFGSPTYPAQLAALTEPPPVLFTIGAFKPKNLIAIIGARNAGEAGMRAGQEGAGKLVSHGFGIISGGARGIDTAAHQAALEKGGYTMAVLGTGVDVCYPKCNQSLFEEIKKRGALVSELLPGTQPQRGFFPTRNRIVAGLALAVVVIQAARSSGALITANYARKFGRPVLVLVPPEADESWEGNRYLLGQGAIPIPGWDDESLRKVTTYATR